jgi:hypothetical protein
LRRCRRLRQSGNDELPCTTLAGPDKAVRYEDGSAKRGARLDGVDRRLTAAIKKLARAMPSMTEAGEIDRLHERKEQ